MTTIEIKKAPSGLWEIWELNGWGGKTHLGNRDNKTQAVRDAEDLLTKESGHNWLEVNKNGVVQESIKYIDGVEQ